MLNQVQHDIFFGFRLFTNSSGMTCSILGVVFLIVFKAFHYSSLPYFFAIFFGIGYAATAALPPLITADFFEGQGYGGIFGAIMLTNGLGGAFGAWFGGFVHDLTGSYLLVFVIVIACACFSSLTIWKAAPRKIRLVPGKSKR